jgi:hypothetical protein
LRFETKFENLLEYDSGSFGLIPEKKTGRKSRATVPLKSSQKQKTPGGKRMSTFKLLHGQNYAENCGSKALKLWT